MIIRLHNEKWIKVDTFAFSKFTYSILIHSYNYNNDISTHEFMKYFTLMLIRVNSKQEVCLSSKYLFLMLGNYETERIEIPEKVSSCFLNSTFAFQIYWFSLYSTYGFKFSGCDSILHIWNKFSWWTIPCVMVLWILVHRYPMFSYTGLDSLWFNNTRK